MDAKFRTGRPPDGSEPRTVRVIHVGLDEEASAALQRLEAALGNGVGRGRTSIAVRRALLASSGRVKKEG